MDSANLTSGHTAGPSYGYGIAQYLFAALSGSSATTLAAIEAVAGQMRFGLSAV